jgi:sugar lactone lactonase YvrE
MGHTPLTSNSQLPSYRWAVASLILAVTLPMACNGAVIQVPFPDTGLDTTDSVTGDTESDTDTDTDTDTDSDTDSDAKWDCEALEALPVSWDTLQGFTQAEDFDFDREGHIWSADWNGNLVKQTIDGTMAVVATQIQGAAGTHFLPDGDLIIAETGRGQVTRVTPEGGKSALMTGFSYPNGVTVGPDGMAYVTEHNRGLILQVDPETLEVDLIAEGLLYPNGIALGPDNNRLYACSFGDGSIYALDRQDDGSWGDPYTFAKISGGGGRGGGNANLDGLNVDACGNVYVTQYIAGKIWRVGPEGGQAEVVATLDSNWIPNLHWGKGYGGFERDYLYVSDRDRGRLFALHLGVGGTTQAYE